MGIKPIFSVACKNESISIKNSLPYLKCVLRLSCVVHSRFMGYNVVMVCLRAFNFFLSYYR